MGDHAIQGMVEIQERTLRKDDAFVMMRCSRRISFSRQEEVCFVAMKCINCYAKRKTMRKGLFARDDFYATENFCMTSAMRRLI